MTVIQFRRPLKKFLDPQPLNMAELERIHQHVIDCTTGDGSVIASGIERPTEKSELHYYFDIGVGERIDTRLYLSIEDTRKLLAS